MNFYNIQRFWLLVGAALIVVVAAILYFSVHSKVNKMGIKNKFFLGDRIVQIMNESKKDYPISDKVKVYGEKEFPKSLRFAEIDEESLEKLSVERIELFMSILSFINERDDKSDSSVEAAEWLISQLTLTLKNNSEYPGNVTIKRFFHLWKQLTVILRFEGSDPILKSQLVILGVNVNDPNSFNYGIGFEDVGIGSESAVLLETARVLLEANFIPKRSLELHWYPSAQGSKDIAETYTGSGFNVFSMVKFNTICYYDYLFSLPRFTGKNPQAKSQGDKKRNDTLDSFLSMVVGMYLREEKSTSIFRACEPCYKCNPTWSDYGVSTIWPLLYPCYHYTTNVNRALQFA